MMGLPAPREVKIAELELHASPRVDRWEGKAAFQNMADSDALPTPPVPAALAIARQGVVDLTSRMGKDGSLTWDVPAGRWVILRLGYSLTGHKNGPASREATGYEVDKLSGKHVRAYMDGYLGPVAEAAGPYFGKSLRYLLMDSWEAGVENWTDDVVSEFQKRRGYDPTPYLPVLTGRVVDSADASDRFLWTSAHARRPRGREPLRPRDGDAARAQAGPLRRGDGAALPTTADACRTVLWTSRWEFGAASGQAHSEHPTDVARRLRGPTSTARRSWPWKPSPPAPRCRAGSRRRT
jgi:hypothetical protein